MPEHKPTELTEHCDRCSKVPTIYFLHERDQTDLVFCQSHYQKYALILVEQGFTLVGSL